MSPLPLADISNLPWVAIIAVGGSLCIGPFVIYIVFSSIQRRHEMWHQTARIALEKGQPLPPMPADVAAPPESNRPPNDIRNGLVLIAVGAGLFLFLSQFLSLALGYVGAIPGFIGVALLLHGLIHALVKRNQPPADHS
ncbi:MAG TPA: DUF6249 domain-containing protein [Candidatus Didemnitutus sp.]|nr:DUF6249 domain-containing protein [Candidatus Didemnitutus sp.]